MNNTTIQQRSVDNSWAEDAFRKYPETDTVFDVKITSAYMTFGYYLSGHAIVDYGDGSTYTSTNAINQTSNNAPCVTHTYPAPGIYTVVISPTDNVGFWYSSNSNVAFSGYRSIYVLRQIGTMQKKVISMLGYSNNMAVNAFAQGVKIPDGIGNMSGFMQTANPSQPKRYINSDFTVPDSVTNIQYAFGNFGQGLVELPDSFQLPPRLTTAFFLFYENKNLKHLPANLKLPKTVTSVERMFRNCPNLEFDISNLFPEEWAAGGYTCNFTNFADNAPKLTGTVPEFIFDGRNNFSHNTNSFHSCTRLSNYNQIPASWGGGGS